MQKLIVKKWDKYWRLTIIQELENKWNKRYFKCECDCWNIKKIEMSHLRNGKTKSSWVYFMDTVHWLL